MYCTVLAAATEPLTLKLKMLHPRISLRPWKIIDSSCGNGWKINENLNCNLRIKVALSLFIRLVLNCNLNNQHVHYVFGNICSMNHEIVTLMSLIFIFPLFESFDSRHLMPH